MTDEEKHEMWLSVLSVAYNSLSASEFDYLLKLSPFQECKEILTEKDDPEEFVRVEPWEPHPTVELYFA